MNVFCTYEAGKYTHVITFINWNRTVNTSLSHKNIRKS